MADCTHDLHDDLVITIAVLVLVLLFDLTLAILVETRRLRSLKLAFGPSSISGALAFGFLLPGWTNEQAQKNSLLVG